MSVFENQRSGTGTKEWAEHNVNIGRGCSHDCLYCYARERAMRFKQINTPYEWPTETINPKAVNARRGKKDGAIMFPTTHDITPYYLDTSITVLKKLLEAGNNVLIVSKPRWICIGQLLENLEQYKDKVLFRFTIGSLDYETCKLWEPGAPEPIERLKCLIEAFKDGWQTSVSMEPMLDDATNTMLNFDMMQEFVTDKIWIGKMNQISRRVYLTSPEVYKAVEKIKHDQRDSEIIRLVKSLRHHPKVAWKDSIKQVISYPEYADFI